MGDQMFGHRPQPFMEGVPLAVVTYRPPEGVCWCSITVGGGQPHRVAVSEISSLGCVVGLQGDLKRHEYADVTLEVDGKEPLTLFAHVVNVRSAVVHLRWLHFEPGEEAALAVQLGKLFDGLDGIESEENAGEDFAWRQEQGTRRVVRPRGDGKAPASVEPERVTRREMRPNKPQPETNEDVEAAATSSKAAPKDTSATPAQAEADEYAAADAHPDTIAEKGQPAASAQEAPADKKGPSKPESTSWRERAVPSQKDEAEHVAIVSTKRIKKIKRSQPSPEGTLPGTSVHTDAASRKILSRSRTVQASELAARHDKVRVLNMSTIKELIKESVAEAMVDINTGMSSDRLAEEVEKRVDQQLAAFKAEKQDAQAQTKRLEEELANAKVAIDRERKRAIEANSFTVSETGMADLERRLERLVATAIRNNGVSDSLAEELRGMVTTILDDERDKIAENVKKSQADTIELLERKISRLSSSLEESQKERDRHQRTLAAIEKSGGAGLRNIMTAGLADDDPDLERKKALMKEIIAENRSMRQDYLAKHGELPGAQLAKAKAEAAAQAEAQAQAAAAQSDEEPSEIATADAVTPEVETTEEAAEASAADAGEESSVSADEDIDPYDLPWDGSPIVSEEQDPDSPVKKIAVSVSAAAAKAPPLSNVRKSTEAESAPEDEHDRLATQADDEPSSGHDLADEEVNASPEIDPDDLPWEGPPESTDSEESPSGIKKISSNVHREPPPFERS